VVRPITGERSSELHAEVLVLPAEALVLPAEALVLPAEAMVLPAEAMVLHAEVLVLYIGGIDSTCRSTASAYLNKNTKWIFKQILSKIFF